MQAGLLRHSITIQQRTGTVDGYGGQVDSWVSVGTCYAMIEPLQGRELFNAQTVNPEVTARITMRYLPNITPAMRIVFEGKFYNINAVVDQEMRHRELILLCSEGLNGG